MTVYYPQNEERAPGRPRRADAPKVPWEEVERLLVTGEEVENENGFIVVHYPSYRDLGVRYGVAPSLIAGFSQRHNCLRRRKDTKIRAQALAESLVIERRAADLAVTTEDALRIIDMGIIEFGKALEEGRARVDTVADLNTLLRLKQLLLGDADSRQEVVHGISLEDLQQKHAEMLRIMADASAKRRRQGQRLITGDGLAENKSNKEGKYIELENSPPETLSGPEVEQLSVQLSTINNSVESAQETTTDPIRANDSLKAEPTPSDECEADSTATDTREDDTDGVTKLHSADNQDNQSECAKGAATTEQEDVNV